MVITRQSYANTTLGWRRYLQETPFDVFHCISDLASRSVSSGEGKRTLRAGSASGFLTGPAGCRGGSSAALLVSCTSGKEVAFHAPRARMVWGPGAAGVVSAPDFLSLPLVTCPVLGAPGRGLREKRSDLCFPVLAGEVEETPAALGVASSTGGCGPDLKTTPGRLCPPRSGTAGLGRHLGVRALWPG